MYLKSIKAFGFKSFADKTEIELTKGIIGIVGPNGSGKSNIVDAVKWVFGEQSVKNLRANNGKMSDVIFNGSKSRNPLTKASVSLVFNNDDHYLNCDFNEIEITRILYNSGENEYLLNNTKVRLKDITDLFIDSGASKETFNIISQGKVQEIINMNPYERRTIFEEAAGVLKYKRRKEESLRKLEKTSENLTRVNLIIKELSESIEPLRIQSEAATKYLNYKTELEGIEIALIANDITTINDEYKKLSDEKGNIEQKILYIETLNKKDNSKIERLKLNNIKLDEKISELNSKLISLTENMSVLESNKQIALERKKYEVDDLKLESNITFLKEEELKLKNSIALAKKDIELLNNSLNKLNDEMDKLKNELDNLTNHRKLYISDYNNENQNINNLKYKINNLKNNLENDLGLSYAARNVLNNPRLKGIHNAFGKLIKMDERYTLAIETILGAAINNIIVDNDSRAKEAISYLKENSLGRATFFPLNVIKAKYVENDVLNICNNTHGFIDVAANLVTNDSIYDDIIKNQLGNILVVDNIDTLNQLGKSLNYRYRIVSLDGEVLHTGGSITGGKNKQSSTFLQERHDLDNYEKELIDKTNSVKNTENNIKKCNEEISIIDEKINNLNREILSLEDKIAIKSNSLVEDEKELAKRSNEITGTKNVKNNSLDKEINDILENYYSREKEKELLERELLDAKKTKSDLIIEIENEEKEYREYNSEYNGLQNKLKDLEVSLGKMDVRLDSMLVTLNETYQMTYENARDKYFLDLESSIARLKVNNLKHEMKLLGEVNTGSIAEFERINKRYTFLTTQASDLELSINNLEGVINEMDEIMIDKFKNAFGKVKDEFSKVYKILFKGGDGLLELTDPDDILNTGVEIKAIPPGKRLHNIGLLSGGEKALTSLALLFAILNIKVTPFCILDEVEDALDEANVDVFGKYIKVMQNKTQFIIITHKKRTMEYADLLYGITMQESGVSKIVSVKLEGIQKEN